MRYNKWVARLHVAGDDGASEETDEVAEVRIEHSQISAHYCNGMVILFDVQQRLDGGEADVPSRIELLEVFLLLENGRPVDEHEDLSYFIFVLLLQLGNLNVERA